VGRHVTGTDDAEPNWNSAYEVDVERLEAGIVAMIAATVPAAATTPVIPGTLGYAVAHDTPRAVPPAEPAAAAPAEPAAVTPDGPPVARPFENDTAASLAPLAAKGLRLTAGRLSYGVPRVFFQANAPDASLVIGNFCSIGGNCKIFVGGAGRHYHDFATTSPLTMFFRPVTGGDRSLAQQGDLRVSIGSDVWIGEDVTILAGVRIGHGAIIGTHTVVTRDVPPYSVVGGVPARLIRFRFGDQQVRCFLRTRWWDWPDKSINDALELFYNADIDYVLSQFETISQSLGAFRGALEYWT
jgi:acetyltransferase-like isoleucine patch superfamily enzyme